MKIVIDNVSTSAKFDPKKLLEPLTKLKFKIDSSGRRALYGSPEAPLALAVLCAIDGSDFAVYLNGQSTVFPIYITKKLLATDAGVLDTMFQHAVMEGLREGQLNFQGAVSTGTDEDLDEIMEALKAIRSLKTPSMRKIYVGRLKQVHESLTAARQPGEQA